MRPAVRHTANKIKKAVVLVSGGLDSAVTLYYALSRGYSAECVAFDYGQRHRKELRCAAAVCRRAGCRLWRIKIAFPWKGSSLVDASQSLPSRSLAAAARGIPSTYVPGRNIIFLSHAVSLAEAAGARAVFIGAHSQDYSGYPDCRPEFYSAFQKAIGAGTRAGVQGRPIKIIAPLINSGKAGIIRLGKKLGVPFELTWSCYAGGSRPCGTCDSCLFRAKGFKEAGLVDPGV